MKKMLKILVLGIFAAMLMAVTSVSIFAQDGDVCDDFEANAALYKKYTENYRGDLAQKKIALAAAKEYVQKYTPCEAFKAQVDYLKPAAPKLEKEIAAIEEGDAKKARYARFNKALKANNTSEIFASGEDILKFEPDLVDVVILLASVGLDQAAVKEVDTYNDKTIKYAEMAINKLNSNAKSETYGLDPYEYGTKQNALGWMNYAIGLVKYDRQNNKDEGLNYYFKSTQFDSDTKDKAFIYALIGDKYANKVGSLLNEIRKIVEDNDGQDTFEAKSKFALAKGYADRGIDAYARAYNIAKKDSKADATYISGLYTQIQKLHKLRYEVDANTPEPEVKSEIDTLIAKTVATPMPNPDSEVKPINPPVKEEPATDSESTDSTDSSTSMNSSEKKPAPKTNGAKPKK